MSVDKSLGKNHHFEVHLEDNKNGIFSLFQYNCNNKVCNYPSLLHHLLEN